jgi:hypothetical protein
MDVMAKMLRPGQGDRVLDIGCGNGRFVFFKRPSCGELVGIDAGPFAAEPLRSVDLAAATCASCLEDASFDKAFDVLEYLTERGGADAVRSEASSAGEESSSSIPRDDEPEARPLPARVNRLVRYLTGRPADNAPRGGRPIANVLKLARARSRLGRTGFVIESIRYYNVSSRSSRTCCRRSWSTTSIRRGSWQRNRRGHAHSHQPVKDVGRWAHLPLGLARS